MQLAGGARALVPRSASARPPWTAPDSSEKLSLHGGLRRTGEAARSLARRRRDRPLGRRRLHRPDRPRAARQRDARRRHRRRRGLHRPVGADRGAVRLRRADRRPLRDDPAPGAGLGRAGGGRRRARLHDAVRAPAPAHRALGAGVAVSQSAEFALVPAVSGDRSIQSANGLVETARYIGFAVGPLAGGALRRSAVSQLAMLVDAGSFLAVAVVASRLRVRRHPEPADG